MGNCLSNRPNRRIRTESEELTLYSTPSLFSSRPPFSRTVLCRFIVVLRALLLNETVIGSDQNSLECNSPKGVRIAFWSFVNGKWRSGGLFECASPKDCETVQSGYRLDAYEQWVLRSVSQFNHFPLSLLPSVDIRHPSQAFQQQFLSLITPSLYASKAAATSTAHIPPQEIWDISNSQEKVLAISI